MNDRYQEQRPLVRSSPEDEQAAVRVDRAQTELMHGRAVCLTGLAHDQTAASGPCHLVAAVETLNADRLAWLASWGAPLQLLLTAERASTLGLSLSAQPGSAVSIALPAGVSLEALLELAAVTPASGQSMPTASLSVLPQSTVQQQVFDAALALAKNGRLMPALLVAELPATAAAQLTAAQLLSVSTADVQRAPARGERSLRRVSDAQVAIEAHEDCEVVLFREDAGGAEHLAIIVGQPDFTQPVPLRLHSACLTGDLLGSLRCDCGDQLRRAITRLAEHGGVLLYLQQEGRSIGLANKLRAYRLQDEGLDTIDADRYLGFMADERDYTPALAMLKSLGIKRVRLLTNNPRKIAAIEAGGIEVVERLALYGPVNPYNARYIETKQQRAGHLKED
ncbi:MAG: GTP cyclohydrolase [Burkholderiales bacterium PBB1]|nr:MAG: GTP cyclohydrolase [Burkholderiales bacterium PBB1]